ncbi:hypothetical protein [Actinoallomurus sp. NPDC050550]
MTTLTGGPATRALTGAGITTLAQVAALSATLRYIRVIVCR